MGNCSNNSMYVGRSLAGCPNGLTTKTYAAGCGDNGCGAIFSTFGKTISARKAREATREKLKDFVLLSLGAPRIKIELDSQALDMVVDYALRIFEEYAPREFFDYFTFDTTPGKSVYKLPPNVGIVRNVYYRETGTIAFQSEALDGAIPIDYVYPGGAYSSIQGGLINPVQPIWGRMGEWVQYKQYEQMFSKLSSNIGGWEWVNDLGYIKLYPIPCRCSKVGVHYLQKCKDWKEIELGMEQLALSWAMVVLGNIRGRFNTIPGTNGLSLDGEYMRTKGWELFEKAKDDMLYRYGEGGIGAITWG